MTRNKQRLPEGDDGRTIADMNVEGMPWYRPESEGPKPSPEGGEQLSKKQMRMYTWGAMKAALLVTGCFCLALVLFILFCVKVWFR